MFWFLLYKAVESCSYEYMNILPLVGWYWGLLDVTFCRCHQGCRRPHGRHKSNVFFSNKDWTKRGRNKKNQVSSIHYIESGRIFGWGIRGKNQVMLWRRMNFAWFFFEGDQKENIHETTTESILGRWLSQRACGLSNSYIFISNLGVDLYWHENDQINLVPDWIMFKCLRKKSVL